ncbi:MAG: class I SAM-dependent RNA methyltransferase [Bacteroidia bacterium]|nr:class I SAM-dependent RNA methyltransferase [Bacteroidia bacterium]
MQNNDYFLAKTFHGLEPILAEELRLLGATHIEPGKRMVTFRGDQTTLYRANLHLRTATRVLVPIKSFRAMHDKMLYDEIRKIQWKQFMRDFDTFAIDAVAHSRFFHHSLYVALKSKDAIVDQFRDRTGNRPSVDIKNPKIRFHIHIFEDQVTVYRDSSGESLHRRGYRQSKHPAPINEALAAGMILLSGWNGSTPFIDPMCGSGTIAIEAALIAMNRAPGIGRSFGFESWTDFNRAAWKKILDEAQLQERPVNVPILASDSNDAAVREARDTVEHAGLRDIVSVNHKEWSQLRPPQEPGTIIINPPYGERINDQNIEELYRSLGDGMKQNFPGWQGWIISSNLEALKKVGLRADHKFELYNAQLRCRFLGYDLYVGTKEQ